MVTVLPLSPIAPDSADDSVTATMGSSREESIFPSDVGVIVPPVGDVHSGPTADELRAVSPLPSVEGLLQDLLWAPVAPRSPDIADRRAPCSADQVPRWWLAREGPFLAERSPDTIVHLVPDVRFRLPTIGHRTTLRRRGSSVFPCIIRGTSSGLVFHSRLSFLRWDLDGVLAVLWDVVKLAIRVGRSRKAEGWFLMDTDLSWGQQVAVMFQVGITPDRTHSRTITIRSRPAPARRKSAVSNNVVVI